MKRKGLTFAVWGLVLGLLLGIVTLALKRYIGSELVAMLAEEVAKSCDCQFAVDSVDVSIFRRRATATNARIISNGEVALRFRVVQADFNLSELSDHKILITSLILRNGLARGVGEDSATFKFIDYLSAPIPPERDRPDRWRLKLLNLSLRDSQFLEPSGKQTIHATGVSMEMARRPDDTFLLIPTIDDLTLSPANNLTRSALRIGKISGSVWIKDNTIQFPIVRMLRDQALAMIHAESYTHEGNRLQGDFEFKMDAESMKLPAWLQGSISGPGTVSGSLGHPTLSGSFIQNGPLALEVDPGKAVPFSEAQGNFSITLGGKQPMRLSVPKFSISGSKGTIDLNQPIEIHDDELRGSFQLDIGELSIANYVAQRLHADVLLGGTLETPDITATGNMASVSRAGFSSPPLTFSAQTDLSNISLQLNHSTSERGSLAVDLNLQVDDQGATVLRKLQVQAKQLALGGSAAPTEVDSVPQFILNASGALSESSPGSGLTGVLNGVLTNTSNDFPATYILRGEAAKGTLSLALNNQSGSINAKVSSTLSNNAIVDASFALNNFEMAELVPALRCTTISAALNYKATQLLPLGGNGRVQVSRFDFGCDPYRLTLTTPIDLPIVSGGVQLPSTALSGVASQLKVQGGISLNSGFSLRSSGTFNVGSLLTLIPSFDDIFGILQTSLSIDGPIENPSFTGSAHLTGAGFSTEKLGLAGSKVEAQLSVKGSDVTIESLSGEVNSGTVKITGTLLPFAPERSAFSLTFDQVTLEPMSEGVLTASGDVKLTPSDSGLANLSGNLVIHEAQFEKNLDLVTLLQALSQFVFPSRPVWKDRSSGVPRIALDIQLAAPRNMFILTNWLSAELRGDVHVGGTIDQPVLAGEFESLSGWFGIRDRRFDITSGRVLFQRESPEPTLDVVGETTIRSRLGDTTLVIIEVTGPISAPKVVLSSDRGLSQAAILDLVAAGSDSGSIVVGSSPGNTLSLLYGRDTDQSYGISRIFRELTTIDSLSLEPKFNDRKGTVEPALIASKNLSDRLALVGESFLGNTENEEQIGIDYELHPRVSLKGRIISSQAEQRNSVGVDLTYTVIDRSTDFLKIDLRGNKQLSSAEILKGIKLTLHSRVPATEVSAVAESIERYYRDQGFFDAHATTSCEARERNCHKLEIEISEGPIRTIDQAVFLGDPLPDLKLSNDITRPSSSTVATAEVLIRNQKRLTQRLRAEGYISSRVSASYQPSGNSPKMNLVYEIKTGKPVSFIFKGNRLFSAEDFLSTINLFSRSQPFGGNTINILVQNIERLYRDQGYLYAEIKYSRSEDDADRVRYSISISEGPQVLVGQVSFIGASAITPETLTEKIEDRFPKDAEAILHPRYAIAEDLDDFAAMIRLLYREEGYPAASVAAAIVPLADSKTVEVEYIIHEGEAEHITGLKITGLPEGVQASEEIPSPLSVPKINQYIEHLRDHVVAAGYISASLRSEISANDTVQVQVDSGSLTKIGPIVIEGLAAVSQKTVLDTILLQTGDVWTEAAINISRNRLLKLGLFSRVEMLPEDGSLDQPEETLLIRVAERSLQTLKIGTGANSEYGVRIFAEAIDRELFGDGRSLSLTTDAFYDLSQQAISRGVASLGFYSPTVFGIDMAFKQDLRYQKLDLSTREYDLDRVALASYLSRFWESGFSATFGHTILTDHLANVSPDVILSDLDTGTVRLSYLSGTFSFDRRDYPLNPRSGYSLGLDYQLASEAIGSEGNYYSANLTGTYIWPFALGTTDWAIANHSQLGGAWTFAGTEAIPITQRYYLGGRNTVRGFREDSLGPKGDQGGVIGGDVTILNNLELRYYYSDQWMLLSFFDAGNVFLQDQGIDLGDLRTSIGLGFRYLSPLGPLGIDVGHPLDEQSGESSVRVHFSFGTAF